LKLPRDLSGRQLSAALARLGIELTRQTGSHIRVTTQQGGEHHVTIPDRDLLKVGTLGAILRDVASHSGLSRDALIRRLFS
jgi:predicted RNA binding protein YcfA (HicA-like mRNA interferase family)